jgi:hypothetical protein
MFEIARPHLIVWVNIPKLPRLCLDDSRAIIPPLDFPTHAPALLFSKVKESVYCAVLA